MARLEVVLGDITKETTDAIVNAANSSLLGGGGVDGAIHRAAGSELLEACKPLNGCKTGCAKLTPGFKLPAKFVIHAVGPVWHDGSRGEDELLAGCYRNSIQIAADRKLTSISFPCISTGVYRFPFERAAQIAIRTVREAVMSAPTINLVRFVCFGASDAQIYKSLLVRG